MADQSCGDRVQGTEIFNGSHAELRDPQARQRPACPRCVSPYLDMVPAHVALQLPEALEASEEANWYSTTASGAR